MAGHLQWVLLVYRLPREPSTPRIAVWRKLRRLGAAQIADGMIALPLDARTKEQVDWLADEVAEADGDASVWVGRLSSARQERELAARMASAVAADYVKVLEAATTSAHDPDTARRRTLGRLRRELRRIGSRDYFPPHEREAAHGAVEALATELAAAS